MEDLNNLLKKSQFILQTNNLVGKQERLFYFFDNFIISQLNKGNKIILNKIEYLDCEEIILRRQNKKKIIIDFYLKKDFKNICVFLNSNELYRFEKYLKRNKRLNEKIFETDKENRIGDKEKNKKIKFEIITWFIGMISMALVFILVIYFEEYANIILPISTILILIYLYYVSFLRIKNNKKNK